LPQQQGRAKTLIEGGSLLRPLLALGSLSRAESQEGQGEGERPAPTLGPSPVPTGQGKGDPSQVQVFAGKPGRNEL
jgi:hypothetical protein